MANPELTAEYFKKLERKNFHPDAIRIFGKTGWFVSQVGFGGYRVHHASEQQALALNHALLNGINLIDTSSNYSDGGSELLIGKTLQELTEIKQIARDEIIVVSKVGYIQGQNLNLAIQRESKVTPFPEVVKYMDGCWHCIHPEFLEEQLRLTLARLQLDYLDVYLLHNPEYFLSDAKKKGIANLEEVRTEYYRRIKLAFEWMEEKEEEGKIQCYGISSNTFPNPSNEFEFTSLENVIAIADEISSDHHFYVIQFPFNLYETDASLNSNQVYNSITMLDYAIEKDMTTLVNRPLNAMSKNGMVRLASFRETDQNNVNEQFEIHLANLHKLEIDFKNNHIEKLTGELPQENLEKVFLVTGQLKYALAGFQTWSNWDHTKSNVLIPQVSSYINYINKKLTDDSSWQEWSKKYIQTVWQLSEVITLHYENQAGIQSRETEEKLNKLCPDLENSPTLSQKSLRVLSSVRGVDCVLLGMRQVKYVSDALETFHSTKIGIANDILRDLQLD